MEPAAPQTDQPAAPMTSSEAEAAGFTIDRHCYPWVAYKGERFRPSEWHHILTDTEADLLAALKALTDRIEDNPTLFFGMEDTCRDEFDDARFAIAKAEG